MEKKEDTIICLLDVLGFENLFKSLGLEKIVEKYKMLTDAVKNETRKVFLLQGPDGHPVMGFASIESAYFSDSIMYWVNYDTFRLEVLLKGISELICKSIEIGLPLRGSASIGKVSIDMKESVFLGQPIIDAARGETAQNWVGFTLSKTFGLDGYNKGFKADYILQYEDHIKKEKEDLLIPLVLDYPRHWRATRSGCLVQQIEKLKLFEECNKNTINFVKYSEKMHDWWKRARIQRTR